MHPSFAVLPKESAICEFRKWWEGSYFLDGQETALWQQSWRADSGGYEKKGQMVGFGGHCGVKEVKAKKIGLEDKYQEN